MATIIGESPSIIGRGGENIPIDGVSVILPPLNGDVVWTERILDGGGDIMRITTTEYGFQEGEHGRLVITTVYLPLIGNNTEQWNKQLSDLFLSKGLHLWDSIKIATDGSSYHRFIFPFTIGPFLAIVGWGIFALLSAIGVSIAAPALVTSWQLGKLEPKEAVIAGPKIVDSARAPIDTLTQATKETLENVSQGLELAIIAAVAILVLLYAMKPKLA